jgi:hypothetical protein
MNHSNTSLSDITFSGAADLLDGLPLAQGPELSLSLSCGVLTARAIGHDPKGDVVVKARWTFTGDRTYERRAVARRVPQNVEAEFDLALDLTPDARFILAQASISGEEYAQAQELILRAAEHLQVLPQDETGAGVRPAATYARGEYEVVRIESRASPEDCAWYFGHFGDLDDLRLGDFTAQHRSYAIASEGTYRTLDEARRAAVTLAFESVDFFTPWKRVFSAAQLLEEPAAA